MDSPFILTLNLTDRAYNLLEKEGFNLYRGSLGKLVNTKNEKYEHKYCLLNYDLPPNIHEYNIIIVDFSNEETIDYFEKDHTRTKNKTGDDRYLLCEHPRTIFDPRALSSYILHNFLKDVTEEELIIIAFQAENIDIEYTEVEGKSDRPKIIQHRTHNLYDILYSFPFLKNKFGRKTYVKLEQSEFSDFLNKYNKEFYYQNIFRHPSSGKEPNPNFFPLVVNGNGEIVSFAYIEQNMSFYTFPTIEDNSSFILEFLRTIAPGHHPAIFPNSSLNKWTLKEEFFLPNHKRLTSEKEEIRRDYESEIQSKELEISSNIQKYKFLHNLLTETGDSLVSSIIKFLEWLGFNNIIDVDSKAKTLKEEDIRIETATGLLVIEVKGIGGTSRDSECSQILKIKYRRAENRNKFDVYGLYIVNHQRHVPANERKNPPFTKIQIQDSVNEERGLLSTWQLFNLYFDIENGIINKHEARNAMYGYGLITFRPTDLVSLGAINEILKEGSVFILNLHGAELRQGLSIFVEKNDRFRKLVIEEIQLDGKAVKTISHGEVGIKGSIKVSKNSTIWLRV